jgi:hypothetical protein
MKRLLTGLAIALLAIAAALLGPPPASAVPYSLVPTNGGQIPVTAQAFSWLDNLAAGPVDHWYMEISTSPEVDYFYFGTFTGPLAYASGHLTTSSINLNTLGRALAPGTYYWHVNGFYGAYGSLGTYWSPVQSFTVRNTTAPAPAIGVNPSSMYFAVEQGDVTVHGPQNLAVSNIGGGTLTVWYANDGANATWLWWTDGSTTQYVWTIPITVRATSNPEWAPPGPLVALPTGTYTTDFTLVDVAAAPPHATNSPKLVPVTLQVFATDNVAPSGPTVVINNGAPGTNNPDVVLGLSASDAGSGLGEMCFSNDGANWSPWMPYATTRAWRFATGDGVKTVLAKFRDKVGNESAVASDAIALDTVAPGAVTVIAPAVSTAISKTSSFPLTWACSDPAPSSGIAAYELFYRVAPSTAWVLWGAPLASASATFSGTAGATYEFQVRATDGAGNVGPDPAVQQGTAGQQTVVPFNETSARYKGTWKAKSQANAYMGKVKSTRARGAAATFKVSGTSFSLLVTKGPGRSKAKVYVDGKLAATVDTRAGSARYRQLLTIRTFTTAGSHTVKVVNSATKGRVLLELDGLAVTQ